MSGDPGRVTEDVAHLWFGVAAPNATALALAADLHQVIASFEAVRGCLRFEEEPSDFEAALLACRDVD